MSTMQSVFEHTEDELSHQKLYSNSGTNAYSFSPVEEGPHSRTRSIPLPKTHVRRTESENNLSENLRLAEFRDQCMFDRLICGIQKQQQCLYNAQTHSTDRNRRQDPMYNRMTRNSIKEEVLCQDCVDENSETSCSQKVMSSYNGSRQVIPIPGNTHCFEENKRSMESILCTRQQQSFSPREESLFGSSPPQETNIVPNDDEESDFRLIFEMEL